MGLFAQNDDNYWGKVVAKELKKRNKVIKRIRQKDPNYFKWQRELELDKFSTYIYITPRGLGKTHTAFEVLIDVYMNTGEWSAWMRSTDMELKEIIADYKANRPSAWPEWATLRGRQLIDTRTGSLMIKFVALSTIGNLASITGNNCFGIYYDEFLPRGNTKVANAYDKLTDFIRTVERELMVVVMMGANLTTLNSDILVNWDLWDDTPEVDDLERRMKFRLITDWPNPPKVIEDSTASAWASNSVKLKEFMEKAQVLDNSKALVIPRSRLGGLRHYRNFMLDGIAFTESMDDNNMYVLTEGHHSNTPVYMLTTEDSLTSNRYQIVPQDLLHTVSGLITMLQNDNLMFTSFEVRDAFIKFTIGILGKYRKKIK